MTFVDRRDAGARLAPLLGHLRGRGPVVLGIPRGGVPVAAVVADSLGAPLDVVLVRKLGAPGQPEYAIGAVGERGVRILDGGSMRLLGVSPAEVEALVAAERAEVVRRASVFRGDRAPLDLAGRTVIIVDDGIATGATAAAACRVVRMLGAEHVVVAAPVAPREGAPRLRDEADELVVVETHAPFHAVALWYTDFRQTSEEEVVAALRSR